MQSYRSKIVFKDYTPKQMMLLPPSLQELIEENHPVRIVERIVTRNHNLERHKRRARKLLISEKGIKHRCQRSWDVEGAFGIIKQNKGFRRFLLRGKKNVEIEAGIIAIAHNISKLTALKPNYKKIAC